MLEESAERERQMREALGQLQAQLEVMRHEKLDQVKLHLIKKHVEHISLQST